jgi:hypothetical protein
VVGYALTVGINCFGQLGVGESMAERKKPAILTAKGSLADTKVCAALPLPLVVLPNRDVNVCIPPSFIR